MRLDHRAPREADGTVLAHAVALPRGRLPKGTRLDAAAIARLDGIPLIEVAVPEPGDVAEDEAATRCAAAMLDDRPDPHVTADVAATGRVNLRAAKAGVLLADRAAVDALNAIDPRLTVATLPDTARVAQRDLVATLKVIPFFVPGMTVAAWEARAAAAPSVPALRVAPWHARTVSHLSTVLPGTKGSVLDKTRRALVDRLRGTGTTLRPESRVPHEREALAAALRSVAAERPDVIVVFGASAVTDAADVVPSALIEAGGRIERVGMPVDPGNLLVWGRLGNAIVLGAPGCARSPAPNGFDWALDRALAGVDEPTAIAALGVGGLLKETPRGRPREAPDVATGNATDEGGRGEA